MKKTIISLILCFSFFFCIGQSKIPVAYHTFLIKNCNGESRIINPLTSVNSIYYLVYGSAELKKMKTLNCSNTYKVDTSYIISNVAKLKSTLPKNYFGMLTGYEYSNQPNDDSIWFIKIFAQITKSGQVKIYSAYKMTFEGTDPSDETFRADPKITNIQFILDKKQIIDLEKKLKELSKGTIH